MDLPWNPAVLEQRIGRVHRLGQKQPVRVVNFVAQGTIEEGMLSVLKFKKSLFAGVLDGGEKDVFLGGSRLTKFMETVEKATGDIPEAPLEDGDASGPDVSTAGLPPASRPQAQRRVLPASPAGGTAAGGIGVVRTVRHAGGCRRRRRKRRPAGTGGYGVVRDARTGEQFGATDAVRGKVLGYSTQCLAD